MRNDKMKRSGYKLKKKKGTKKKVNQTPGESEQMLGHLENLNIYSALFLKIYKKNWIINFFKKT